MEYSRFTPPLKSLLSELNFIGLCPAGKKIDVSSHQYTDGDRLTFQNVRRYCNGENRVRLMEYINELLARVEESLKEIMETNILVMFQRAIKEFIRGIEHLQKTYQNDPSFRADSTVTLDHARLILGELEHRISL